MARGLEGSFGTGAPNACMEDFRKSHWDPDPAESIFEGWIFFLEPGTGPTDVGFGVELFEFQVMRNSKLLPQG